MRRIVVIVVLVVVVGVAAFFLLRPKRPAGGSRTTASTDTSGGAATKTTRRSGRRGRTTGRIQLKSKKEIRAEKKLRRKEERNRKREARRHEREKRKLLREARRKHGNKRRGRKGGNLYVVRAIVSLGSESYALVDGRRVGVGDVVMGRRIVEILPDRLEIEAFGRRSSVRVGESLLPTGYTAEKRQRRG